MLNFRPLSYFFLENVDLMGKMASAGEKLTEY